MKVLSPHPNRLVILKSWTCSCLITFKRVTVFRSQIETLNELLISMVSISKLFNCIEFGYSLRGSIWVSTRLSMRRYAYWRSRVFSVSLNDSDPNFKSTRKRMMGYWNSILNAWNGHRARERSDFLNFSAHPNRLLGATLGTTVAQSLATAVDLVLVSLLSVYRKVWIFLNRDLGVCFVLELQHFQWFHCSTRFHHQRASQLSRECRYRTFWPDQSVRQSFRGKLFCSFSCETVSCVRLFTGSLSAATFAEF